MAGGRSYTDDQLARAVTESRSWRGVLRSLGLSATSAAALRSVRGQAERLGLDHSHFTGQRRWSDGQLAAAVAVARSWAEVSDALGLAGGSSTSTLKGHALRLGLSTDHLVKPRTGGTRPADLSPDLTHLRRAGPMLAAAWFTLCGCEVAWPLEPCSYDLLVRTPSRAERVQVKTTTVRSGRSWVAKIADSASGRPYDPDEVDSFFVIDGEMSYYLIPMRAVGGLRAVQLSAYAEYQVSPEVS